MSSGTLSVQQLLDIADAHYAGGETRIADVLPVGTRGDLLADLSPTAHREAETAKAHRG